MTALEFGRAACPGATDQEIDFLLWEETRFPFYDWPREAKAMWRDLRRAWRRTKRKGAKHAD